MTQELRRKQIEEILSRVITRETHKGTRARVVIQTADAILALLSDAERKGAEEFRKHAEKELTTIIGNGYVRKCGCEFNCAQKQKELDGQTIKAWFLDAARQVAESFGPDPEGEGK